MRERQVAIETLVWLPREFKRSGAKTLFQILEEGGVWPEFNQGTITESTIASLIKGDESIVQTWLQWSEDKRTGSGWYFRADGQSISVGFHPNGPVRDFADPVTACAVFILAELNSWAIQD